MVEDLYFRICSYDNLLLAFKKARKGKTAKAYVLEFERELKHNLLQLRTELLFHAYKPIPLQSFIIHDPKTRKISKSAFRDRIIHHALCNVISPIFEKGFIHDSFANRIGKGAFKAIERFDIFQRIVSKNYSQKVFVLKADIKKYFDNVSHELLLSIIQKKISDKRVICLIRKILANYCIQERRGMPLGNLTSQFFANVFLNELDQFVKHNLKAKYYIRYVDDFVILDRHPGILRQYMDEIRIFLNNKLALELHPDKSRIIPARQGIEFLGMRIFPHYKLLKKKNLGKFYRKLDLFYTDYEHKNTNYDIIYNSLEGWCAYATNANTYKLRTKIMKTVEKEFCNEVSTKEINRLRKMYKAIGN